MLHTQNHYTMIWNNFPKIYFRQKDKCKSSLWMKDCVCPVKANFSNLQVGQYAKHVPCIMIQQYLINALWIFSSTEQCFFFFTFFYVNRRKYWFHKNFQLPVYGGFTRFGMSWTWFDYFWKMCLSVCVCLCDKIFEANVAQELMHRFS